jgi:hypothetical protein
MSKRFLRNFESEPWTDKIHWRPWKVLWMLLRTEPDIYRKASSLYHIGICDLRLLQQDWIYCCLKQSLIEKCITPPQDGLEWLLNHSTQETRNATEGGSARMTRLGTLLTGLEIPLNHQGNDGYNWRLKAVNQSRCVRASMWRAVICITETT